MSRIIPLHKQHYSDYYVRNAGEGDQRAMKWLFDKYAPKMLGVAQRYLGRIDWTEEAVSSGFAKAFDHIRTLQDPGKFEGWLKSIIVRESIDLLRREKKHRFAEDIENATHVPSVNSLDGLQAAELMKLIDTLPSGYRTVFNLYAIEGYTHQEIGVLLGISENTSKTQYKKAREAIQSRIGNYANKEKCYGSN